MHVNVYFTGNYEFSFFFGVLTVLFWALTYLFIIFSAFKSRNQKRIAMPYVAGALNFSWEFCALLLWKYPGVWAYIIWFVIDLFFVYFSLSFLPTARKRLFYLSGILISGIVFFLVFQIDKGFIYSVYTIDLIMEFWYLLDRKKLSVSLKCPIAVTKLLGDLFAGFVFYYDYPFVVVTSTLVVICNSIYLYRCIKERKERVLSVV